MKKKQKRVPSSGKHKTLALLPVALSAVLVAGWAYGQQASGQAAGKTHVLRPTPTTVAWGYYDAAAPPALRIQSGDLVEVHTLLTSTPERLAGIGVKPEEIQPELRDIVATVTGTNKGPGGHILTGPIYIDGAEPGDVLEVRIESIKLAIPYAYTAFRAGGGTLPEDFPYARIKLIPLDMRRMVAEFSPDITIPLRPFFGSMGVAPPPGNGRISSVQPWIHAGNLDNKELVAGSTLFIPVHVRGALFEVGDGHAAQGDGEVCITALETSLVGRLRFFVRKGMRIRWPRAETATSYISMGIHESLDEATKMALREMIDFLVHEKKLDRDDAYMLASVAADLHITQLVDGNKGVHALLPRAIFRPRGARR